MNGTLTLNGPAEPLVPEVAKGSPPMTRPTLVALVLSILGVVVSAGVMVGSFLLYQHEVNQRLDGQCVTITKVGDVLRGVLDVATEPRSTANVTDPNQLARIVDLNNSLAEARSKYRPLISVLTCDP